MARFFRCVDQICVLDRRWERGHLYIRDTTPEEPPPSAKVEILAIPSAALRVCFEGHVLDRATAVAGLSGTRFAKIFGTSYERRTAAESESLGCYSLGSHLRLIGRRITDPRVRSILGAAPLVELLAAAQAGHDPDRQIRAAVKVRIDRSVSRNKRGTDAE